MATRQQLDKLAARVEALASRVADARGVATVTQWLHEDERAAYLAWLEAPPATNRGKVRVDWRMETESEALAAHMAAHPQDVGKRVEFRVGCHWMTRAEAQTRGWA
jgi:hypothetical protein